MNDAGRRRTITILANSWMAAAVVLITAVFLALNWYYYRRTHAALDREFGIRLRSLASLAAATAGAQRFNLLEPDLVAFETAGLLQAELTALADRFALAGIHVLREDGVVLFSTRDDLFPPGESYPLWNMDFAAIIGALEGTATATGLYRSPGGGYLKAGYAPVPAPGRGPVAVAAVEADVDFLQGLDDLRAILIVATILSAAGLVVFILFATKATSSLIRARESLLHAETLASMGRMTAGIAHEIRNPLFIIRGSAERLRRAHPEEGAEIDEFIIEEVDRLNCILTDYLLLARNESTSLQQTDLAAILRRCVHLLQRSGPGEGIVIATEFETGTAPLAGEEKRLQQAFLNILLNAIQALDGAGRIDVTLERTSMLYVVRFLDTGRGIPAGDLERIFEPFFTTRPAGSGLGLSVARRVIEDHGGSIEAAPRAGGGTVISVVLPLRRPAPGDENEHGSDR